MCKKQPTFIPQYTVTGEFTGILIHAVIWTPFTTIEIHNFSIANRIVDNKLVIGIHFREDGTEYKAAIPTPVTYKQFITKDELTALNYNPKTDGITINGYFGNDPLDWWVYGEDCFFNYLTGKVECKPIRYWIPGACWPA